MVSYEEAYNIAKKLKTNIDGCIEYENGYVFYNINKILAVGGPGLTRCVILKSSGKAIPFNEFIIMGTGKEIREFDIK